MDQQLKQRLIGTTIVVSLIVIFVPLFFEDKSQRNANPQMLEMSGLPRTLEERAMELPKSASDVAEEAGGSGGADSTGTSGYRIIPLNDPPPKPAAKAAPAPGKGSTMESGTDEEYTILDEGSGRDQPAPANQGRSGSRRQAGSYPAGDLAPTPSRAAVYPLTPNDAQQAPANRNHLPHPVEPAFTGKPLLPPGKQPGVAEAPRAPVEAGSWMIQAGSFTGEANARNLVDKLRKSNFPAFVEVIPGESGNTMYRVRIGPEPSKARAEQVRSHIESTVGIKGMLVPHQ